jgi:signal transduction histidine kinase
MLLLSVIFIAVFNTRIYDLLRWLNSHAIAIPLLLLAMLLFFFVLMSIFFLGFTRKSSKYLENITTALGSISDGNLKINIPIETNDELGELARSINSMTLKLNSLLEEEREWERSKNELITNVSHDLRTPLTSILGYVELISRQKYIEDEKFQQYVNTIREKCIHLKNLIDDLFEYSNLTGNEAAVHKVEINLAELLEQVIIGFIPVLKAEGLEYRIVSGKSKVIIFADPILLARLFDNLISNAVSYGKNGKYIDIELFEEANEAVVKIANYGEDIPEEDLPHIFERLYSVEKSRSRQRGGTGLGLAIVKSIADIHNGTVNVISNNGKTVFEVRLRVSCR